MMLLMRSRSSTGCRSLTIFSMSCAASFLLSYILSQRLRFSVGPHGTIGFAASVILSLCCVFDVISFSSHSFLCFRFNSSFGVLFFFPLSCSVISFSSHSLLCFRFNSLFGVLFFSFPFSVISFSSQSLLCFPFNSLFGVFCFFPLSCSHFFLLAHRKHEKQWKPPTTRSKRASSRSRAACPSTPSPNAPLPSIPACRTRQSAQES